MNPERLIMVEEAEVSGKTVFCRLDFDVPLDEEGNVVDDHRIRICLPTINYLLQEGAEKIVLAWKLGRPKNQEERFRTDKTATRASQLLGHEIDKIDGWSQEQVEQSDARIVALENLRFHPGEQASSKTEKERFAAKLSKLADIYVNDAFACSHRRDTSIYTLPRYLPAFIGLNLKKELDTVSKLDNPQRPLVVILGGKKQEKLAAVDKLLTRADKILVGGVPANTLLQAQGQDLKQSQVNQDRLSLAKTILSRAETGEESRAELILPQDLVVAKSEPADEAQQVAVNQIPSGCRALDLGERTMANFKRELKPAATIVWSGALGLFERKQFERGTRHLVDILASSSAFTVAGGGETSLALKKFGSYEQLDFVSSGGGAFLQLLTEESLPGLQAIVNAREK